MERVDDVVDVRLLEILDARIEGQDLLIQDRVDLDPVHVVRRVERVTLDVERDRAQVESPPFEEHHRDIDPPLAGGGHAVPEPAKYSSSKRLRSNLGFPSLASPGPVRAHGCGDMHRW